LNHFEEGKKKKGSLAFGEKINMEASLSVNSLSSKLQQQQQQQHSGGTATAAPPARYVRPSTKFSEQVPAVANPHYSPTSLERNQKNQQKQQTSVNRNYNGHQHLSLVNNTNGSSRRAGGAHHPDGQELNQYEAGVHDKNGQTILTPQSVPKVGYVNLNAIAEMPDTFVGRVPYGISGNGGKKTTASSGTKGRQFFY
jgi:hypothetical protein